ncbi:MAG: PAS domain-containing sensor histidine kinase [Spirochaetales bacterium]|nr:PAS domain-containing sensor histidine kinase [Spirochaetales bacterium]MCF7938520.1 PAS domain-containing sensor histidine kinase [Spirochaetales bacterium]
MTHFAPAERADDAEIEIQKRKLKEEKLLEILFDSVPQPVLILNRQRQIVYANQSAVAYIGKDSTDELIGLRPGEAVSCIHAEEMPGGCGTSMFCSQCGAVRAILSSQAGTRDTQECRITTKSGDALDLRVWATPFSLQGNDFTIFYINDISNEKRRRVLERIFFHDILNTAGGLQSVSELLEHADYEEMEQFVRIVQQLSDSLIDEIRAQRILTAAENNELEIEPGPIESIGLLEEVVQAYEHYDIARDKKLLIDTEAESVEFRSDRTLVRRVISNLVKNALEAEPAGSTITLCSFRRQGSVEFTIHNPTVMNQEVKLQIFNRSFSTKGAGRGIGTYSIKLLTERYLGGTVDFVSEPQTGTIFTLRYPIQRSAGH